MKDADQKSILNGVSTLELMKIRVKAVLFLAILTAFTGSVFGQHATLNVVDPTFNPEIVANLYGGKTVQQLETLPDGKILAFGIFNSYNRVRTGNLVRLNADGSLDTTFNNQTITSSGNCDPRTKIIRQPDGKIIVACRDMVVNGQAPKQLLRFNADGTLDTSFNYTLGSSITGNALDSLGRIAIQGGFETPQGLRLMVRLNSDGSLDNSFDYTPPQSFGSTYIAAQGSRVIVGGSGLRIFRLNENGSEDTSFALSNTNGSFYKVLVQPDNKILYITGTGIFRLNENGGNDSSFQTTTFSLFGQTTMKLAADGKIVVTTLSSNATYRRYLANGGDDLSFTPYIHMASSQGTFTIQPDGSVILGDFYTQTTTQGINNFIRLTPGGVPDPTFNPGGIAFQTILPGSIRSIEPLSDGKVYLGGKFDVINTITRNKIARLNADSSVDSSFQINTSGTGNYFALIIDAYHIRVQTDGRIVVSGWFNYFQDGVEKKNLVRLNSDGSIDTTFDLSDTINDWSEIVGAGRNPLITFSDGKLMVGISRLNGFGPVGPWKFNQDGSRDTSFTSMLNSQSPQMYIDDVAPQPDGKILVSGSHDPDATGFRSFVARLNADGSLDQTFPYTEETGRLRPTLALLPNGKILVGKHSNGTLFGRVERLNADGSPDALFNSLSIANGIINALLSLPNGKIFVGGRFTVLVNGQETKNLLRLDADGNIEPTTYNVNEEVLCLAVDSEGRVLVGGSFTVIGANGAGANRSYVARLTDSPTLFDYDGDGKADVSVYRPSNNYWYLSRSSDSQFTFHYFGAPDDIPTPADYDGDGKTDLAIFRPSSGDWWYQSSITGVHTGMHWGSNGDIPRPSDFDGDGRADYVVYHPANNYWYRLSSGTGQSDEKYFGAAGDKPVIGDFDGDGKSDPAIFRPSTGTFWYMSSIDSVHRAIPWGTSTDIPVPADYDGDGKTDAAVYRPSTGFWYIYLSATGTYSFTNFGISEDRPVPADYDGDGKADIAVYRPSNGTWYMLRSTAGFNVQQFGNSTDVPTPNTLVP